MNPLKKITTWQRRNFAEDNPDPAVRQAAELETLHDLQKPIQQLLCDAHEEAIAGTQAGVTKRMVALLAVTAYEQKITNFWLLALTIVIVIGTFALVCIALCPYTRGG
jgi:hypothetical protein